MPHFERTGFAASSRPFFRRPSTCFFLLGAGLLAADRLRWLPTAWTGAILITACGLLVLGLTLLFGRDSRDAHRREVRIVILPLKKEGPL